MKSSPRRKIAEPESPTKSNRSKIDELITTNASPHATQQKGFKKEIE